GPFVDAGGGRNRNTPSPDPDFIAGIGVGAPRPPHDLPGLERLAIGGIDSVRGYRQNLMIRDQGGYVSAELSWPLFQTRLGPRLLVGPFVDAGGGRNRNTPSPDPDFIAGIGVGARWVGERLDAQLYFGQALIDVDIDDRDIQDRGLHFALRWRLF
ncbi:MAG: ShlB/FhaC/HecB family hemolysin secretion/activation protein, partial [Candidatus Competibacterales bacterium]